MGEAAPFFLMYIVLPAIWVRVEREIKARIEFEKEVRERMKRNPFNR